MTTTLQKSEVIDMMNMMLHRIEQLDRTVEPEWSDGERVERIDRNRVVEIVKECVKDIAHK